MRLKFALATFGLVASTGCGEAGLTADSQSIQGHEDGGDTGADAHVGHDAGIPPEYFVCEDVRSPQVPKSEVELIDTLVPHHRMAIEMADMELARGEDASVLAMAEMMKATQAQEIEELLAIREDLTGSTVVVPFRDMHMERDMKEMAQHTGLQMDVAFLANMIPHHAGALQFTHNALPEIEREDLLMLAHNVIEMQGKEIGEMTGKKAELCTSGSVECEW